MTSSLPRFSEQDLRQEEYERFANAEAGKPTGVKSNEAERCDVCGRQAGGPGFSMFVSRIFPYRVLAVDPWLNAHSPFSPHSAAPCPVVYQELG